jgi:hypothetical protein
MGELILGILVMTYFCYGLYALYREIGNKSLPGLREAWPRTRLKKKMGQKYQKKQG